MEAVEPESAIVPRMFTSSFQEAELSNSGENRLEIVHELVQRSGLDVLLLNTEEAVQGENLDDATAAAPTQTLLGAAPDEWECVCVWVVVVRTVCR